MNGGESSLSATEATSLAPGFRFHPTDEELVSYYLKRKVLGKPFKVAAISEIDLYKSEPWDLPRKSLIQSRDLEWYFFSALDKKYANRSKTNRATGEGYWKTTGKDRPVRRNSRTVGMKKTLVFHVGRAPKGERTNWVMHEYRLENEDMARAGYSQDAYVVCRIFQKSDSGPQNGAQYGAPLIEEDWEEDESVLVLKGESAEDPQLGITIQEFQEQIGFAENQEMGIQNENVLLLEASVEAQDGFDDQLDLGGLWQDQHVIDSVDANINMAELYDGQNSTCMLENSVLLDQNHSLAILKDDYVELNDFANSVGGLWNDHNSTNEVGDGSNIPQLNGVEEFFNTMEGNATLSGQSHMYPTAEGNDYLELNDFVNPVPGDCPSGEPSDDDMIFLDAPSNLPFEQDYLFETMADSSKLDSVEELLAYFDATENNLQDTAMNTAEKSDGAGPSTLSHPFQQVEGGSIQAFNTSSATSGDKGACTSMAVTEMGDRSQVPDVETDIVWNGMLTKRLVSMLGSISSPPAFAAEYPMKGAKSVELNPETQSSQSIHFTAGMIKINGLNRKHWPLQKNGDVGFLLSYGMARNDHVGNSKMHCGTMSVVLQSSCCRFFFSLLFLAASFKMGSYIYGK